MTDLLGFPQNDPKDQCGTVIPILGYEVDTNEFILRVPANKLQEAYRATAQALEKESLNLMEADYLAGFLGFSAPAVQLGRVFLRQLWSFIASFSQNQSRFLKKRIPKPLRDDLTWWRDLLPKWNGIYFFDNFARHEISLFTDASGFGLGGYYTRGKEQVNPKEIPIQNAFAVPFIAPDTFDINIYELKAIEFALRTWGQQWAGSKVTVFTDNKASEQGILKETLRGGANAPLRECLLLAAQYNIALDSHWIPGASNILADALSRFDDNTITNLCPHWQNFSTSILLRRNGRTNSNI